MPKKTDKKGFLLRVPPPLLDELRRWAEQEMRSINGQIEWALRDALRRHGRRIRGEDEPTADRSPASNDDPPDDTR